MAVGRLDEISRTIGAIETNVRVQGEALQRDREERIQEHRENQARMGEIAQATSASIAELSRTAAHRWDETCRELASLGRKLEDHAKTVSVIQPQVAQLQVGRGRIAAFAGIGVLALWAITQALTLGYQQFISWVFKKFSG